MKTIVPSQLQKKLRVVHSDERGDAVQTLLLIALIAVPLILLLIYFKDKIFTFVKQVVDALFADPATKKEPPKFN